MSPINEQVQVVAFTRSSEIAACQALIPLLVLCGCGSVKVRLGLRASLDKGPVVSMEASLPKNPGIAPGEKSPLVVTFTEADCTVLVTEGEGKGKVLWRDLTVTANVVSVNKKGIVSLPRDPRISDGKMGHVTVTVPSHPTLRSELDVPLDITTTFHRASQVAAAPTALTAPMELMA